MRKRWAIVALTGLVFAGCLAYYQSINTVSAPLPHRKPRPDYAAIPQAMRATLRHRDAAPVYRETFVQDVLSLIRKYGRNGETLDREDAEKFRQLPQSARDATDLAEIMESGPGADGALSVNELDRMAQETFSVADADGDGALSQGELDAFSRWEVTGSCRIPQPAADAQTILIGAINGRDISTQTIAGQNAVTTVTTVRVAPGRGKVYVIAYSFTPVIWRLEGETARISRFVAVGPVDKAAGKPAAGVTGVAASSVSFLPFTPCLPQSFRHPADAGMTLAAETLTGRKVDMAATELAGGDIDILPSGDVLLALPGRSREVPLGVDPLLWALETLHHHNLAGIAELAAADIISPSPAAPYAVLPGAAGLAQLAQTGALRYKLPPSKVRAAILQRDIQSVPARYVTDKKFWIVKEIGAYPAGVTGTFVLAEGVKPPPGPAPGCLIAQETGTLLSGDETQCRNDTLPAAALIEENACPFKHAPAYRDLIGAAYKQGAANVVGKVSLSKTGNDGLYFASLRSEKLVINETPQVQQINTLALTDVFNPEASIFFIRSGDDLILRNSQADARNGVTIANWFRDTASGRKPVSCFSVMPGFYMLDASEIDALMRRQLLGTPAAFDENAVADNPNLLFADLPPHTRLHLVQIYESNGNVIIVNGKNGDQTGTATVNVLPTADPVVIVVASYEPVHWTVTGGSGARIAGVIVGGYHRQSVDSDIPGLRVVNISNAEQGRGLNYSSGVKQETLTAKLHDLTGIAPERMAVQGEYKGSYFEVK